jgi:hypothetical protein
MQNAVEFINLLKNLESRHYFNLALTSWLGFVLIRRFTNNRRLTLGVFLVALLFTVIWLESQNADSITKISDTSLELLKIIVSWPLVILFIFWIFRSRIDKMLGQIGDKISSVRRQNI